MEEKNFPENQPEVPAKQPVNDDVKDFMALVQGYGKPAAIAVILVAVAFFAWQTVKNRNARQAEADSAALFQAQAPEELLQMAQTVKGSTAPLALSMAATQLLSQDRFDEAQAAFQDFLARFPEHQFAGEAELGSATCLEGMGEYAAAAEAYGAWLAKYGNGTPSAAQAVLSQVRCLSQAGKFDEARIALENYQASNDNPEVERLLKQSGSYLEKARRAAEAPAMVAEAVEEAVEDVAAEVAEAPEAEEVVAEAVEAAVDEAPAKKAPGKKKSGKKSKNDDK